MKSMMIHPNGFTEILDFPEGDKLSWYYEKIGCDLIDVVEPYALAHIADVYGLESLRGKFCLIVDDEGLLKEKPEINLIASLLYGADHHGQALFGNVIVAKNDYTEEGADSVGMDDSDLFLLRAAINSLIEEHNEKVSRHE